MESIEEQKKIQSKTKQMDELVKAKYSEQLQKARLNKAKQRQAY